MFKYLAGIFAKPDNYYVDGRLATPLTTISPSKKWLAGSLSTKRPRIRSHSPVIRSTTRKPKVQQVLEPVSYIVNVSDSCSSNDENESIVSFPTSKLPRAFRSDSNINIAPLEHRLNECRSSLLEIQIPGPPQVSPDQSYMSLNVDTAHGDDASNWDQLPYASDKDVCCDWELGWLPEEFWSIDTDAVTVNN